MSRYVIGLVTCGSRAEARKLARAVLAKKAAACVNILDGIESQYWWLGKLERGRECLLLIKTTKNKTKDVMQIIEANHSYQVPEIIFVPVAAGERRYLKWIRQSVSVAAILLLSVAGSRADVFDNLVGQLGSANEEERAEAAEKIAQIGGARAQEQFRKMVASDNPERRQTGVVGLLQVSDAAEDVERVHARLKDENSTVRWSAALALGESGRAEAIPWLEEAARSDDSESVREAATDAVAKLQSGIKWVDGLPASLKKARESKRPVLAYFFLRGSQFCRQLEEGVLADKAVADAAQEFVCVRVDAGAAAGEARKFDVRGAPTILILDGEGNEMSRVPGLMEKDKLLAKLADARRGSLTFREARRHAMRNPADVPANWKLAETYLDEGREDLAEPYLRNVINYDEPNQHGHTDNALFALGFAFGKRGKHAQAAYCMEQLLQRWPQFKDKDKALYCLGLSQLALKQKDKGRAALEQLVAEFPSSTTAGSAKLALEKLGAK
jgi:periplasmic divalent cation tolerance protein